MYDRPPPSPLSATTRTPARFIFLLLLLSPGTLALADEITDRIANARAQYEAGELRAAMRTLQFAIAGIQEKVDRTLLSLLPAPLPGWQADEAVSETAGFAALVAGTNLTRRYLRDDGALVEISILADSPMLPMMTLVLTNPLLVALDPDTRVYSDAGQPGTIEHEPGSDRWRISLLVADRILLQVEGSGLSDEAAVEAYLRAVDLDAVRRAFGA